MKTPILIIGFPRSGTTLLRRIVSMHPGLDYELIHEDPGPLLAAKSKEEAIKNLTYEHVQAGKPLGSTMSIIAGQKIPYSRYKVAKSFINQFGLFFGDFSIMHIYRNPVDTVSSGVKTFSANPLIRIVQYFLTVPRVRNLLQDYDNVLELRYEDLIRTPAEVTSRIYDWIGGAVDAAYIERVLTTKDPWVHGSRVMPGLRYFDKIENRISRKPALSRFQLLLIKVLSKVFSVRETPKAPRTK